MIFLRKDLEKITYLSNKNSQSVSSYLPVMAITAYLYTFLYLSFCQMPIYYTVDISACLLLSVQAMVSIESKQPDRTSSPS